jgi:hypothetical protein
MNQGNSQGSQYPYSYLGPHYPAVPSPYQNNYQHHQQHQPRYYQHNQRQQWYPQNNQHYYQSYPNEPPAFPQHMAPHACMPPQHRYHQPNQYYNQNYKPNKNFNQNSNQASSDSFKFGQVKLEGIYVIQIKDQNKAKKQKIDKRDLPENNQFFCEACDRGFKTDEKLKEHVDTHRKCNINGCKFEAAEKLVQIHYKNVSLGFKLGEFPPINQQLFCPDTGNKVSCDWFA